MQSLCSSKVRRRIFNTLLGLSHPGVKAIIKLVEELFVWPNYKKEVAEWSRCCGLNRKIIITICDATPLFLIPAGSCGNLMIMVTNSCRSVTESRGCGIPVVKVLHHGRHVKSSSALPLKTRHVWKRSTQSSTGRRKSSPEQSHQKITSKLKRKAASPPPFESRRKLSIIKFTNNQQDQKIIIDITSTNHLIFRKNLHTLCVYTHRQVEAVAEWSRYQIMAGLVMSSSPVPLKTRRVGQRCTLNLSRAQTSSRWCVVAEKPLCS
ncbi:hypothetical protein TNCV_2216961 [Trichonephila clavipes]|nr:hypothetical protein TNCV_2216961 [Trichonephila clavipes]